MIGEIGVVPVISGNPFILLFEILLCSPMNCDFACRKVYFTMNRVVHASDIHYENTIDIHPHIIIA